MTDVPCTRFYINPILPEPTMLTNGILHEWFRIFLNVFSYQIIIPKVLIFKYITSLTIFNVVYAGVEKFVVV